MSQKVAPGAPVSSTGDKMEIFPDIHNKMSKKIAQLTKVIYHLNTKNEDHQTELENLSANHQLELQQVLRDATARFSKLKEGLEERQKQVNIEAQMEKLQKKYSTEKESASKDFQMYKVKVAEREQRIASDFQKKYDALNEEVEKMNAKFLERMRAFEASTQELKKYLDDARSSSSAGLQEMRKKYENEIAELVRTSNIKYQDMLVEQLRIQELLKKEHGDLLDKIVAEVSASVQARVQQEADVQIGQLRAKLKGEKEADLMAQRREFEERIQQQRDELMGKLEKALGELRDVKLSHDDLKNENVGLQRTVADLTAQLAEMTRTMGDQLGGSEMRLRQLAADLQNEKAAIVQLQVQLREREEEIERVHRLLKEKNGRLVELENMLEKSNKELVSLRAELASTRGELSAVDRSLQDKLKSAEAREASLQLELTALRGSYKDLETSSRDVQMKQARELQSLQLEIERLQAQIRDKETNLARTGDKAAADLAAAHAELESKLAAWSQEKQALVEKYEKMIDSLRQAMTKRDEDHAAAIKAVEEECARREASLGNDAARSKNRHEEEVKELRSRHDEEIKLLYASHVDELAALKLQMQTLETQMSQISEVGEQEKQALRAEMTKLEGKAKAIKAELEAKKKENERAESVQTGLKNQIEALREELKASQKAYRDKMDMGLAKVEADWQAKLDAVKELHAFELKEAAAVAESALIAKVDQLTKQFDEEMQILKNALSAEAAKAAGEQSDAERHRLQLEADLREEKHAHKTEVAKVLKRLDDELALLKRQHAGEIDDLRSKMGADASSQLAEMKRQNAAAFQSVEDAMMKLKEDHEIAMRNALSSAAVANEESTRRMLSELESRLAASHAANIQAEADKHALSLRDLQKDYEDRLENMLLERDTMEQTLNMTLASLAATEKALADEKNEAQRKAFNYTSQLEQNQRDSELVLRREKEASQRSLLEQQDRAAADMRLLKDEFNEDRARFDDRLKELMSELERMERRYKDRESREDDLQRIRELEQQIVDKDELVAKVTEEMKYFKREMLNREESYNVKFNAKPTVGVMQVIKSKEPEAQQAQQVGPKSSKPTRIVGGQPGMGMGGAMGGIGGMGVGLGGVSAGAVPPGIPGSSKGPPLPKSK